MPTATSRVASCDEVGRVRNAGGASDLGGRGTSRADRLASAVPALLVLSLGLIGLDRHSMWRDEAASLVAARRSLVELCSMLAHVETVHAVYYTFLHAWLTLGSGIVWARVPSVLAAAVAAGLVGLLGARVASVRVGLVAGLVFAVNPSVSFYAQEARSTALVAASALLATWFLLQAVERRPRWWVAYGAAGVLLVGLNVLAVLVPVAHAVTLLWWRHPRRVLLRWAVATAPALLVVATLLFLTGLQPRQLSWIPQPGAGSVKELAHLTLGESAPVVVLAGLLVLLGLLPTSAPLVRRRLAGAPARLRLQSLAVPLLVLPPAVLLLVSLVQPVFVPRYVFPSAAAAALLVAGGVERLGHLFAPPRRGRAAGRPAALAAAAVVLVLALGDIGAQRLERTPQSRPDDLAGAAAVVGARARPGDTVLFVPDNWRLVAQVYPRSFAGLRDAALRDGPEQADNLTGRSFPPATVLANLRASTRVWAVGRPGLRLMPGETSSITQLDLLRRDFVPVDTAGAHGVGITLFVRRS